MASLFGIPLDAISNLSDSSEHLAPTEKLKEKMVFVGGRYTEKHNDVFRLFFLNVTEETEIRSQTYVMLKMFVLLLTTVIILCQIGFALLQSGASRKENAVTPFIVNAINLALSAVAFWATGYAISRSDGNMMLGFNDWFAHDTTASLSVDWYLYFSLALTTVNIASSGGLERCPLWVTAIITLVLSGIVHPLTVHWGWHHSSWMLLHTFGLGVQYRDVGGSGPIHAVGGAAALVMSIVLKSREQKMRQMGAKYIINDINGHSVPMEILGGYLITICVLTTNVLRGVSTYLGADPTAEISRGLMNSVISSAVSCLTTLLLSTLMKQLMGQWRFHWMMSRMIMNSILMGAVSVSAGCTVYDQWACTVIGLLASIGYIFWTVVLGLGKIDDVIGSITVHLGGGILGVICLAIFKQKTGLLFTESSELAAMGLLWNLVCVLAMIALTMVAVGLTLALPTMLRAIPLSGIQQLQGMDWHCIRQEAYPNGHMITLFNTDAIEDRETFSDSHQITPVSQQSFTTTLGYDNIGVVPEIDGQTCISGLNDMSPSTLTYNSTGMLPDVYRDLPARTDLTYPATRYSYSPGDRHVWFGGEMLEPEQSMMQMDERRFDNNQMPGRRLEFC